MLLMGDGIQQMQWGTARETRPDHGPSMLELASCMKWGVCNERGGGCTDELVAVAAQKKAKKEGTKVHKKEEEKGRKENTSKNGPSTSVASFRVRAGFD